MNTLTCASAPLARSAPAPLELSEATGATGDPAARLLLERVLAACLDPRGDPEELTRSVHGLLAELQPGNPLEGLLVTQMVGCYLHGMSQLKNAARTSAAAAVALHLKLAEKLQRLFLFQVESLEKLRGRRHQHVRVEHVHVHEGGQAIVGPVTHGGGVGNERKL